MNLKKLNIVELSYKEQQETDGGTPIAVGVAVAAGIWGIYTAVNAAAYKVGYWVGNNT